MNKMDGIHVPARTLKISVTEGQLCVARDDVQACTPATFDVSPGRRLALKKQYRRVDAAARRGTGPDYRQQAETLGRELAGILFGSDDDREVSRVLAQCMGELSPNQYVRVLLSFDTRELAELPWELALWKPRGTEKEIYLGRDCRLALSRFRHDSPGPRLADIRGEDEDLSILNVGTSTNLSEKVRYDQTSRFMRVIGAQYRRLNTYSRRGPILKRIVESGGQLEGILKEIDIVHWCGHGGPDGLPGGGYRRGTGTLSPSELFKLTHGASLYVVLTCASGNGGGRADSPSGEPRPTAEPPALSFSEGLLAAGAAAVLGMHDNVEQEEFEYLPVLYPLLFQGVPLDYCVQYLRRLFALVHHDLDTGPYDRWYKLILHASSASYLDGMPDAREGQTPDNPITHVPELCRRFLQAIKEVRGPGPGPKPLRLPRAARRLRQLETVLNQLESLELCD